MGSQSNHLVSICVTVQGWVTVVLMRWLRRMAVITILAPLLTRCSGLRIQVLCFQLFLLPNIKTPPALRPQDPVQEWGEEEEDGAVFGVTLRREPVAPPPPLDASEPSTAFSFIQYHTVKVRRLKAATLERLLTHLLDAEQQEPDFLPVFLSTYRAFTSTGTLVELLFQRWEVKSVTTRTQAPHYQLRVSG